MATTDDELMAEVRGLTDYDTGILSDAELTTVLELTKRELESSKDSTSLDWYGDLQTERTLFWLTCIFAKIKTGEIDSGSFEISELSVEGDDGKDSIYFDNFWRHYHSLGGGRPRGHLTGQRPNREYSFDN
jgi:hypothetical protein